MDRHVDWGVCQNRVVIGRLEKTVFDCPDPRALAAFYAAILGRLAGELEGRYRVFADPAGHPFCLVFGRHHAQPSSAQGAG
jgi:hypothetical protein